MVRDGGVVLRGFARRRELSHGDERVRFQPAVAHGPRDADARVQTSIGGVKLPKANQTVTRHAKRLTLDTARDGADVVRLGGDILEREDGFAVTPGPEGTLRVAESPSALEISGVPALWAWTLSPGGVASIGVGLLACCSSWHGIASRGSL